MALISIFLRPIFDAPQTALVMREMGRRFVDGGDEVVMAEDATRFGASDCAMLGWPSRRCRHGGERTGGGA